MRTTKRIVLSLVVALTLLSAAQGEQTNAGQGPRATQSQPSGTRWASCVVMVTVDSAIMPLHGGTIQALVLSSDVAGKAAHKVLGIDDLDSTQVQNLVRVECLSQESQPAGESPQPPAAFPGARNWESQGYDRELHRQMEQIYGSVYAREPGRPDSYRERGELPGDQALTQRASLKLTVDLPGGDPVAKEFLQALVENLRTTLLDAYLQRVNELNALLRDVESRRRALETGQSEADTAHSEGQVVKEQLDRIVDLSAWQAMMPVGEAIEILKRSVEPPLQIFVLWRDLEDNAQIEASTPIQIDGMPNVRVRTALETLLKALAGGRTTLSYEIKDNVITIGAAQTLTGAARFAAKPEVEVDVAALAAEKADLTRKIQALYVDLATQEARENAINKQVAVITEEAAKRADQDEIMRELDSLVKISTLNIAEIKKAIDAGRATPTDMSQAQESLTRAKIELARRREELSKSAGGGQLDAFNKELSQMAVERAGKEAQQSALNQRLAEVQRELARAPAFDPAAARMRIIREALDIMARRMAELQTRIANLQPPTVTMIGAN